MATSFARRHYSMTIPKFFREAAAKEKLFFIYSHYYHTVFENEKKSCFQSKPQYSPHPYTPTPNITTHPHLAHTPSLNIHTHTQHTHPHSTYTPALNIHTHPFPIYTPTLTHHTQLTPTLNKPILLPSLGSGLTYST